jgi:hypothetical protein
VGISFGASSFKNVDVESGDFGIYLKSFLFPSREKQARTTAPPAQTQQPTQQEPTLQQPGAVVLNTTITQAPPEGFTLTNLTTITFGFSGTATPQTNQAISFETKIEGFDADWQPTTDTSRTVTLPLQTKQYMFFVRAKLGNTIDPTPAQRSFSISAN